MNKTIEGVAVIFDTGPATVVVKMPKPNRHCDCFSFAATDLKIPTASGGRAKNQGFYDNNGAYLTRQEAMSLCKETGVELLPMQCGAINDSDILYSEDVW